MSHFFWTFYSIFVLQSGIDIDDKDRYNNNQMNRNVCTRRWYFIFSKWYISKWTAYGLYFCDHGTLERKRDKNPELYVFSIFVTIGSSDQKWFCTDIEIYFPYRFYIKFRVSKNKPNYSKYIYFIFSNIH